MNILTFFFIVIIIFVIIFIFIFYKGGFSPPVLPSITSADYISAYGVPSPWSNPISTDITATIVGTGGLIINPGSPLGIITGPITGVITGTVTGPITGTISGTITGNVTTPNGIVFSNLTGTVIVNGNVTGTETSNGNGVGNSTSSGTGEANGTINGTIAGSITGTITGTVTALGIGNVSGTVNIGETGFITGILNGNHTGNVTGSVTENTGDCQLITFSGSGGNPSNPTFGSINSCLGTSCFITNNNLCYDSDQLYAQEVTHTCQVNLGPSAGTGCISTTGSTVTSGYTETYYRTCNSQPTACGGSIGVIVLNFNPAAYTAGSITNLNCISIPQTGVVDGVNTYASTVANCNIGDLNQLLRVQRYTMGSNGSFTPDSSGVSGSIIHRPTGLCLSPTLNPNVSFEGLKIPEPGQPLTLIDCNYGNLNGIWWVFVPPVTSPDGTSTAPQQIVYYPYISYRM